MAKVRGVKTGADIRYPPSPLPEIREIPIAESIINKGMITSVDATDIENGALQLAKNVRVRFDKTESRVGHELFVPLQPDNFLVLKVSSIKDIDGTGHVFRFTPYSIWEMDVGVTGGWTEIVSALGTGYFLVGTAEDRIQTVNLLSRFIFANNGANPIQEIDYGSQMYSPLGNAPNYRYITGFYNRVVGAALRDVNEVQIGWSGEYGSVGGIDEWDPLVEETAGSTPLIESTSDLSDFIKGVFGFTNVMIVMREKSIVLATKQPIATNPFYFSTAVPGIGCDSPYSIAVVGNQGLAWLDRRTQTVYSYFPGQAPEPIGRNIEKTILKNVDDPNLIFGSYDPIENEYSICIPGVGNKTKLLWTYNFRNQTWTYDEIYDLSSIDDIEIGFGRLAIDDLTGIIDNLIGTIDSLSPVNPTISTRVKGRGDGSLMIEDPTADTDPIHFDTTGPIPYESDMIGKAFILPISDIRIVKIIFDIIAVKGGTIELQYSRDGGIGIAQWTVAQSYTIGISDKRIRLTFRKPIKSTKFAWRIKITSGLFKLLYYELWAQEVGMARQTTSI